MLLILLILVYSLVTWPVRYKASKIWNQPFSSLKEFFSVRYFSNKLKEFLQVVDIASIVNV